VDRVVRASLPPMLPLLREAGKRPYSCSSCSRERAQHGKSVYASIGYAVFQKGCLQRILTQQ
jgi:hypothetical protein